MNRVRMGLAWCSLAATIVMTSFDVGLAQQTQAATAGDALFTAEQAERGMRQFQQTCTSCHSVAEHTGVNFASKWRGISVGDVYTLISTTMPENDPGSLKPEQYASILAFFLRESGYKAGEQELPSDVEALEKIPIDPPAR